MPPGRASSLCAINTCSRSSERCLLETYMRPEDRERIIATWSQNLCERLPQILSSHPTEADFRRAVDPLLDKFCAEMGLNPLTHAEYTLATGRADAVFNRLVIEYERPGVLKKTPDAATRHAAQQVRDYIAGLAQKEHREMRHLAGVAFDGYFLIFVRYIDGKWVEEPPVEVNRHSLEKFLTWLAGLASGIALTSENLNRDFSIEQLRTQNILRGLFRALGPALAAPDGLVAKLFQQWRLFFSEAIDYSEAFGGRKLEPLKKWVRKAGIEVRTAEEAERFFFVLHTYFALLVKLLAWLALSRHLGVRLGVPSFANLATTDSETLRRRLAEMESGGIFRAYGLLNLLEGDFFSWYLSTWNDEIETALREILKRLDEYDPTTLTLLPEETRDLFKKLYHYLLPREIRHNLGEYYTPDWLAQRLLNQIDQPFFTGQPPRDKVLNKRFLDPACGSGTFLVLILARMLELGRTLFIPECELLQSLLHNVVGFDLNPLAVLTARVNYLLAIADLLEHRSGEITIPIYLADSVRTPAVGKDLFSHGAYEFPTAVGKFLVPAVLCTRERFDRFTAILEESVGSDVAWDSFRKRLEAELRLTPPEWEERAVGHLQTLYEMMQDLHRRGLNGLWARLLRNNFAPLTVGQFDYIVGNPPWVNWEHLPDEYRKSIVDIWNEMNLGATVHLGKKWDISYLMTQVSAHHLLKKNGKLGFVITQSVFKTNLGARGFRRFQLPDGTPLRVLGVDDMVSLNPFEGASNRTAVMVLQKGQPTQYPVPYTVWRKEKGARFTYESTLDEVVDATQRLHFVAEPVDPNDPISPWLTARPKALRAVRKVLGKSDYKAHEGVNTGGANAVYWVEVVYRRPDGLMVVRNLTEGAKVKVDEVTEPLEPDLLYPLLRGRDVRRWRAEPSAFIIMTYPEAGEIDLEEMQKRFPRTYVYFKRFEAVLKQRAHYRHYFGPSGKPFFTIMQMPGSFAPWKVVWREVSHTLDAAVVSPHDDRPTVASHTLVTVGCSDKQEAHYLCGVLNSSMARLAVQSYIVLHPDPHILENIRIPRYDPANPVHRRLAELAERAHWAVACGEEKALAAIEAEIDEEAAQVWGLSKAELREIQRSLRELEGEIPTSAEE